MTKRVAIVGAGLLGRLLAWRLLRDQYSVSLFEAGRFSQPRAAAYTAAAMVSPFSEAVASNKTIFAIGLRSLALWPQWIEVLNRCTAAQSPTSVAGHNPITYQCPGTLVVAHQRDREELMQFKQDLQGILREDDHSQWLDNQSLLAREADLFQFQQALYLPYEAHLDHRQLLVTLLDQIHALKGRCIDQSPIDKLLAAPQLSGGAFDVVIDCRGVGAKNEIKGLRGVRGEVMWVHCPEVRLGHAVRLMHPRYKLYVVPKPNHHYIIGATEIESEDLSPISLQSNLELASALYSIHPAFAEARIVETDVNLRPAFIDNEPKIIVEGKVIRVNGLHRHGYLLAPTMVNDILCHLNSEQPSHFWAYYARGI